MSRSSLLALFVSVGVTSVVPAFAQSQGTGLEFLHEQRREGRKVCFVDHFHEGTGSGKSRKAAEASAARAWQEFTAWEYGGNWGRFSTAGNKTANCTDVGGGDWNCQVSARPCRPGK